jgi:hypothetical protein
MKTRSQNNIERITFDIIIDFDESSREWNANKQRLGNGTYEYKPDITLRNGKICGQQPDSKLRRSSRLSNC